MPMLVILMMPPSLFELFKNVDISSLLYACPPPPNLNLHIYIYLFLPISISNYLSTLTYSHSLSLLSTSEGGGRYHQESREGDEGGGGLR